MNIKLPYCLLLQLLATSCSKYEQIDPKSACIESEQNADWVTEEFKGGFTIQFPDNNYEGVRQIGFEGNIFYKNRLDNKIIFFYDYCGSL